MPEGKILRPRLSARHGRRRGGVGDHPGRHVGVGHARAPPSPQRRLAQGHRADGFSRRAGHAGRAHGRRAGQAHRGQHRSKSRWRSSSAARSPICSSATPTSFRSRPSSCLLRGGNLEVKAQMKHHVDKWGRARYGEKVWPHQRPGRDPRVVRRHDRPGRGVPQPRNLRGKDPLRHAAEPVARHARHRVERLRRQGQVVQQRLPHPLSRRLGHQRGAAAEGRPGEMGPRPQRLPPVRRWSGSTSVAGAALERLPWTTTTAGNR